MKLSEERLAEIRNRVGVPVPDTWGEEIVELCRLASIGLAAQNAPRYFGTTPDHPSEVEMVCVSDLAPVVAAEGE